MINAPEPNPEDDFRQEQDREHVRPISTFRGQPLASYTRGTRTVYWQVTNQQDTVSFHDIAFLFIHTKKRAELVSLAWAPDNFRLAILEFTDGLTDAEEVQAHSFREECLTAEAKSKVEPIAEKKSEGVTVLTASVPATPPTSSLSFAKDCISPPTS